MSVLRTFVLLLLLGPVHASAYGYEGEVVPQKLAVGDYFEKVVLACWNKGDLAVLVNPKTASSKKAYGLLKSPLMCGVVKLNGYLVILERKFKATDGRYFWIVSVSGGDDKPGFYIALPAEDIKRAP